MNDIPNKVAVIADKIDAETFGNIAVEPALGGVALADIREVMEVAKMMAVSNFAVPKHLQGQQGPCFAICMYALEWRMSPFAVANKSYVVNERLAFESQLLHAVIEQRAPITGRLRHEFIGEGPDMICKVWATPRGETIPLEWTSPAFKDIKIKNSPEWSNNAKKQLYYHTSRDFCRVYFPDVILGVYTDDEMRSTHQGPEYAKDVSASLLDRLPGKIDGDGFGAVSIEEQIVQEAEALAKAETLRETRRNNIAKARQARKTKAAKKPKTNPVGRPRKAVNEPAPTETPQEPEAAPAPPMWQPGNTPKTQADYIVYAQHGIGGQPAPEAWFRSESERALRFECGVTEQTFKMLLTMARAAEEVGNAVE